MKSKRRANDITTLKTEQIAACFARKSTQAVSLVLRMKAGPAKPCDCAGLVGC